jgi:hypothetical protein
MVLSAIDTQENRFELEGLLLAYNACKEKLRTIDMRHRREIEK